MFGCLALVRRVLFCSLISVNCCVVVGLAAECTESFSWLPNSESDLAGYKLYYGTNSGGPYPGVVDINNPILVNGRVYGDISGLTCGVQYYSVCVAYNLESVESNQTSQIAFIPPVPDTGTATTKVFGDATSADYPGTMEDTFLNINADNNVSSLTLNTYTWPDNQVANAILLKLNLSQLPANALVQSATLQLYQTDAGGDAVYNLSVHKIINHNPSLSQSTGYTFDGSNGWTANTQSYDNIPMAQADIAAAEDTVSADQTIGYKSWNVTQMVTDWLVTPTINYGLLVNSDTVASRSSYRTFSSSEVADAGQRPKLTVIYTLPATGMKSPNDFLFEGGN